MVRETCIQYQVESYQRLLKQYLGPLCLTLSSIRYISRVKWSYPWKRTSALPNTLKREPSVALNNAQYVCNTYIYIYIYIRVCVCVCVSVCVLGNLIYSIYALVDYLMSHNVLPNISQTNSLSVYILAVCWCFRTYQLLWIIWCQILFTFVL